MSYFPGLKLTKAGEQLLAKVSGNLSETISFRKAELGSGTINSDDEIRFLTALKEKWKDVNISDCKIVGDEQTQVQIELQFDNAGINTNKIFRELGIYAAANDGREVLFAYSNAKENFDYIPAATDNPQSFVINILITITSNTKVNAQIDLNSYVTLRKFNEELAKKLDKGAVSTEYDTAKKIEDKIKNVINERWKIFAKSIQNGDNLNNITELGFYVNQQNTNNIINSPVSNTAFTLRVESVQPNVTQQYLTQIFITYNTNDIYIRHKQEREWKEWEKIAKLEELTSSINELNSSKLDKGSVPEKYNTAEKIGNEIDNINENGYKGFNRGSFRHEAMNLDLIKKSGFWFMANMTENNDTPTEGGFYGIDSHYTQGHGSLQILADITDTPNLYVRTSPVTFDDTSGKYGKWEYIITSNNKLFTGILGTDSIEYIQDGGTKILNNCYVDKVTGKPYRYLGGEPSNQVNSNFISLDLLSNSLPKFKKIFAQRIKQGQTYNIEDIRKFRALYFRNRTKNIGSILFNDEYLTDITDHKAPFSVYTTGIDASGFSNITGIFISYTQFTIINAQTTSTGLGYWDYVEIIGIY